MSANTYQNIRERFSKNVTPEAKLAQAVLYMILDDAVAAMCGAAFRNTSKKGVQGLRLEALREGKPNINPQNVLQYMVDTYDRHEVGDFGYWCQQCDVHPEWFMEAIAEADINSLETKGPDRGKVTEAERAKRGARGREISWISASTLQAMGPNWWRMVRRSQESPAPA